MRWRWKNLRRRVVVWRLVRRDGGQHCWYCTVLFCGNKRRQRTVDHRVPRALGGTNRLANLVFACAACNQKKAARTEADFVVSAWLVKRRDIVEYERLLAGRSLVLVAQSG